MTKRNIKDISLEELDLFLASISEKAFRAKQIREWLWKKTAQSFDEMTNLPVGLREALKGEFDLNYIKIHTKLVSKDKSIKLAFELSDGKIVEGVLIPSTDRVTACISSQVGCSMNCQMCSTAKMGLDRNLTCSEIFDQVYWLNKIAIETYQKGLTNIVLMGMGEPLLNYNNVIQAIKLITTEEGLGMSNKRITLSTIGLPKMIRKLADEKLNIKLAVSLHAATDEKRSSIIPFNDTAPLEELKDSLKYYTEKTYSKITFEYVMLGGVNDLFPDAQALVRFCSDLNCKINLIEYNANELSDFTKSTPEAMALFVQVLEKKNLLVFVRKSRGEDINGACGQLASKI